VNDLRFPFPLWGGATTVSVVLAALTLPPLTPPSPALAALAPVVIPPTQKDDLMRLIQETTRGIAVIGPGYYHSLTPEELPYAIKLYGAPVVFGNPREFDLARAVATNPTAT